MKNFIKTLALFFSVSCTMEAESFSPKQIFDNGFTSALEVISYSNKLREKGEAIEKSRHCLKLQFSVESKGEIFHTFKLFSLSLKLGMEPIYLERENGERMFCLSLVDKYADGLMSIEEIRKRYRKIDTYNPRIVSLEKGNYSPVFPFLGENNYTKKIDHSGEPSVSDGQPSSVKPIKKIQSVSGATQSGLPSGVEQLSFSKRVYIVKSSKNNKD